MISVPIIHWRTNMYKRVNFENFEEVEGAMNKTAIYDALVYTGLYKKERLNPEDIRELRAKKKKIVTSDIKHQRHISKIAKHLDWKNANYN